MDFSEETVCSVKKESNLGYYRLHTIWKKDGFFINIVSKNGAWRGEMTATDVAKMSAHLEVEPEFYLRQCQNVLTYHGGRPGVVYAVEGGSFVWKKVEDEDSGIKIKLGSVMLEPSSFEDTIQNLVTAALNCNKNLQEKLKEVTEEKSKILENKAELIGKLNELIATKETMENDLYSRFILLINAKKRKISELEILLGEKCKHSSVTADALDNPYDIDTDTEADEGGIFFSSTCKAKTDVIEHTKKNSQNKTSMTSGEPKERKPKNCYENLSSEKKSETLNYIQKKISEPSTSTNEPRNNSKNITDEMSLTKDELYDYFYGEL